MATAVNSKTMTMMQAMMCATFFEILGAMTLGSYNANTVRSAIINISFWNGRGGNLMFGIMCSVISSAIFNYLSNRYGWATSSTHATIGSLIGIGVASGSDVTWGYTLTYNKSTGALSGQNGLAAVVASFVISPAMAGTIGALVYTGVRMIVLDRKGTASFTWALYSLPFWYGFVVAFEGWLISWKSPRACSPTQGQPCMTNYSDDQIIALFFGLFGSVAIATIVFVVPFVRRGVWFGWQGLGLQHLPFMPFPDSMVLKWFPGIDKRSEWFDDRHLNGIEIPETEAWAWTENDMKLIRSLSTKGVSVAVAEDKLAKKVGAIADAEKSIAAENPVATLGDEPSKVEGESARVVPVVSSEPAKTAVLGATAAEMKEAKAAQLQTITAYNAERHDKVGNYMKEMRDPSLSFKQKAYATMIFLVFFGIDREIADFGLDEESVANIHDVAIKYYGKTESVFRFLQFLTSSLATFAHGANDVGLSVGPIAIFYGYWSAPTRWQGNAISSTPVLDWMLAAAAVCLCIGFWFYGYNMMRVLGNRLTYHSPARGFCMEMGAAITVLIAARNGIPVSTTNCIVGATVGVGIASGGLKNVNWKLTFFTLFTWVLTVPACAVVSGGLYAFGSFTPSFGCTRYTVALSFTNSTGGTVLPSRLVNTTSTAGATARLAVTSTMLSQQITDVTKVPGTVTGTGLDKNLIFYSPGCSYIT